eukprot:g14265.t1
MGDAVDGSFDHCGGEVAGLEKRRRLECPGVECLIPGACAAEVKELGIGDRIFAGRWVRGGAFYVAVGVGRLEMDIGFQVVSRDVQEGESGIIDGP